MIFVIIIVILPSVWVYHFCINTNYVCTPCKPYGCPLPLIPKLCTYLLSNIKCLFIYQTLGFMYTLLQNMKIYSNTSCFQWQIEVESGQLSYHKLGVDAREQKTISQFCG